MLRLTLLALSFGVSFGVFADVRVTGSSGASLDSLQGGNALVTVILKDSLARDMNLTVASVEGPVIVFSDENGESIVYRRDGIREVRVQRDRVDNPGALNTRSPIQRADVSGALGKVSDRAARVFGRAEEVPALRAFAAEVAAATGSADATAFLERQALSDNPAFAIRAARSLYSLGQTIKPESVKDGFRFGERRVRRDAAILAGLAGLESLTDESVNLVRDTAPEVFAGGAYAAGYFQEEWAIPYLLRGLNTPDRDKADAAIFGLVGIGSDEVLRELHTREQTGVGNEWFNAVLALYYMGNQVGVDILREQVEQDSPYAVHAALVLADDDYWDANVYLRRFLDRSTEMTPEAITQRIWVAATLLGKGYVQAKVHLRDILTMEASAIYIRGQSDNRAVLQQSLLALQVTVCQAIAENADLSVLPILETALESKSMLVGMAAGQAIVALTNPAYRERIAEPTI